MKLTQKFFGVKRNLVGSSLPPDSLDIPELTGFQYSAFYKAFSSKLEEEF